MLEMPAMFNRESFLIFICELTLEVVHMGGGAMVVEIFGVGVQIHVGDVRMIHIGDVLMNLVDGVRTIRIGDGLMSLVGVVQMILFFGAQIIGVDYLI